MTEFHTLQQEELGTAQVRFRESGLAGGPIALLLHGHTQTPLMWADLAGHAALAGWHVLAPSLHVTHDKDRPLSKVELAEVFAALVARRAGPDAPVVVIGHDLGAMVAYAFAATQKVQAAAIMEATPPGVGFWRDLLTDPRTWHFGFFGPYAERLIEGREEIYLERFWQEFSGSGQSPMSDSQRNDTLTDLRVPGGLRSVLGHFAAFAQDAEDNAELANNPIKVPVLAIGGESSFGPVISAQMQHVARAVETGIIPNAGHWLLEENQDATMRMLLDFLTVHKPALSPPLK